MSIAAVQTRYLPRSQTDPGRQEKGQPVPRRATGQEHRDDLLVARPVHLALGFLKPMPRVQPQTHPAAHRSLCAGDWVWMQRVGGPAWRANGARDRMPRRPVSEPGAYDNTDTGLPGVVHCAERTMERGD